MEEHEELFPKSDENLETRVAAGVRIPHSRRFATATAHIRFDFLLGAGTADAERANHSEGSCPQGAATQVEILG